MSILCKNVNQKMMDTAGDTSLSSSTSKPNMNSRKRTIFLDMYAGREHRHLSLSHDMVDNTNNNSNNKKSKVSNNSNNTLAGSDQLPDHHHHHPLPPSSINNLYTKTDIAQDGCTILCLAQQCYKIAIHRCCSCECAAYCSENCRLKDRERHEEVCQKNRITDDKRIELVRKNFHNYYQNQHQPQQVEQNNNNNNNETDSGDSNSIARKRTSDCVCCCHNDDSSGFVSFCPHCYTPVCQEWTCCKYHLDHCDAYHQYCKSTVKLVNDDKEQWVLVEKPNDDTEPWVVIERVPLKKLKELSSSSPYKECRKIANAKD